MNIGEAFGKAFEWLFINLLFWGGLYKLISSVPESLSPGDIQEHQISKLIYLVAMLGGLGWAFYLKEEREKEQRNEAREYLNPSSEGRRDSVDRLSRDVAKRLDEPRQETVGPDSRTIIYFMTKGMDKCPNLNCLHPVEYGMEKCPRCEMKFRWFDEPAPKGWA